MDINLLVCSDLHSSVDGAKMIQRAANSKEYDLLVVCGDFTTYGSLDYVKSFFKGIKDVKAFAVPGNCDTPETVTVLEKAHSNIHDRKGEFADWHFFGFGGALPGSMGMPFEVPEDAIVSSLRKNASRGGVMVTHMPAFGMNDRGRSGKHTGSHGILKVAQEFKPRLALSGHMHESRGMETSDGVVYVNPGSAMNGFYASVWLGKEVKVKFYEDDSVDSRPKIF
jgi:Icc-related predicted phosphoesterase